MTIGVGIIIGVLILGGAILLVIVGRRYSSQGQQDEFDPVMARLAEATQRGESVSLEDIELEQPFMERVIVPVIKKIGEISTRFTPQRLLQETTRKLELAGNPGRIDASTFLATRFIVPVVFDGFLLLISRFAPTPWPFSRLFIALLVFGLIGFAFPQ